MNAMIPDKLKFDLDLQDLPVRAIQVASEALTITAGTLICTSGTPYYIYLGYEANNTGGRARDYCDWRCSRDGSGQRVTNVLFQSGQTVCECKYTYTVPNNRNCS
ncbi:MAG: hypothetical protein HC930_09635 [Hydrococcus sp. SU_1_0]|nr:hypothetical protein [Hydrococcus sp. SU_1_0]NJO95066.1 hypothetical protein [Pleurocapsa sp. CRU_1_2]